MALPPWENHLWWLGSLWKAASFASLCPEHFWGVETLADLARVYRGLGLPGLPQRLAKLFEASAIFWPLNW